MNFFYTIIITAVASTQTINAFSNDDIKVDVVLANDIQVNAAVGNGLQTKADINTGNQANAAPPSLHVYPNVPHTNNIQIPTNCREGAMMCMNQMPGFYTCVGTQMIYRDCAAGTKCRPSGQDNIVCDY